MYDGAEKPAGEKKPRKPRKRKEPDYAAQLQEEVEEEVLRSGRKRKVRRVMTHFMEGSDEDDKGCKCSILGILYSKIKKKRLSLSRLYLMFRITIQTNT